ncbi:MAG: hypothetical protein LBE74_02130 [Treponema sp.]|jgi:hypothetical protein|nr:hypothetical protein [Treponema sp.]
MTIMKKLLGLTIGLLLSSCLAETYQADVFENIPSSFVTPAPIKSGIFSTSSTDNLLIIKLSSGRFVDSPNLSFFRLNDAAITMGNISRDSDTQITVNGIELTNRSDNRLGVAQEAFKTGAKRVIVTSAKMGAWNSVADAAFGSTDIWGAAYGNGRAVVVGGPLNGGEGKIAYSTDGKTWTALVSGLGAGQSQFQNTVRGVTYGGGDAGGKFVAVGYDGRMAFSGNGIDWEGWWEENFSGDSGVLCVTYGGGTFVAGGGLGKIAYSKDGQEWSDTDAQFGQKSILGLAYGKTEKGDVFVAVGTDGQLAYSSNGTKWTYADAQFGSATDGSSDINAVAFGSGVFVAVGNQGKMSYSRDGASWTKIDPGTDDGSTTTFKTGVLSIAYGSGSFVAVGHNGRMATSIDGMVWTGGLLPDLSDANDGKIQAICYAGDKFIAGGNMYAGNTSRIAYGFGVPGMESVLSPVDITSQSFNTTSGDNTLTITLLGSAFKSSFLSEDISLFALSGSDITNGTITVKSNTTLVLSGLSLTQGAFTLTVKAGALAARTLKTPIAIVAASKTDWTFANAGFGNLELSALAYGNSKFIAGGYNVLAYSSDGVSWTKVSLNKNDALAENQIYKDNFIIRSIAFGNNTFVAVGYQNDESGKTALVIRSTDGVNWRQSAYDYTGFADTSVLAVNFGDNRFVIGGDPNDKSGNTTVKAKTAWSTDGEKWNFVANESFDNESVLSLAYGNNKFIAVGTKGRVAWSTDGTTWSGTQAGNWVSNDLFGDGSDINAIVYGNGKFVAVGHNGNVKTSVDGYSWSDGKDGKFGNTGVLSIAYGNGKFVAVGHNGKMSTSSDGDTWTAVQPGVGGNQFDDDEKITAIATDGAKFVIIGNKYNGNQSKVAYSN